MAHLATGRATGAANIRHKEITYLNEFMTEDMVYLCIASHAVLNYTFDHYFPLNFFFKHACACLTSVMQHVLSC